MEQRRSTVEVLALNAFGTAYRGRRVLVTGHTGFKGSWLCLWLQSLGAEVAGLALNPSTEPSHWDLLKLSVNDYRIDIRDETAIRRIFATKGPRLFSTWLPSRWSDGPTASQSPLGP